MNRTTPELPEHHLKNKRKTGQIVVDVKHKWVLTPHQYTDPIPTTRPEVETRERGADEIKWASF